MNIGDPPSPEDLLQKFEKKKKKTSAANHWCQLYKKPLFEKINWKVAIFCGKKGTKVALFRQWVTYYWLPELGRIPKAILLDSLSCSQIWLIPLVKLWMDDCQSTNLIEKNEKINKSTAPCHQPSNPIQATWGRCVSTHYALVSRATPGYVLGTPTTYCWAGFLF